MFESRCGISCNACGRKTEVNCKGCIHMEKPFWGGKCEVKSCCESKKLNHCGECKDFPCEVVSLLGTEYGYDPKPRLENCRKWAENN
ncbi:MAG: DUF3795 domain-containing protein [Clostridia bacterium]|jgi:hypothetical protein|nr:DUF3795 domain-containing protein [Clostridia bacterium]